MSTLIKYLIPVLIGLFGFVFGYFKKSSSSKVKEAETDREIETLKTQSVMKDAKVSGVKNKDELIEKLKGGKF